MKYLGTVKWFNAKKGYGFLAPAEGGKDVFVHASALERAGLNQLVEGQRVTFELERDRHNRMAAGKLHLVA